jgi:calcium-dependent protein kinase
VLGEGSSGHVFEAVNRETGEACAVKVLNKSTATTIEVNVSLRMSHPNIASILKVYDNGSSLAMVMELGCGGDLFNRLADHGPFEEAEAARILHQTLLAVTYMHAQGYVHTDLKLDNIVFQSRSVDAKVLLIDFGFAQPFDGKQKLRAKVGTVGYMAPEVLKGSYTNRCDMFSLGVIAYALLSGKSAFDSPFDIPAKTNRRILVGDYSFKPFPADVSSRARAFVAKLLAADPEKRPSANEALDDPWLVSHCGATMPKSNSQCLNVSEASTSVPPSELEDSETVWL